jgi:hypothetical protein
MCERTRMPGSLIARLPNVRLIVTTGMRNLALDVEAAKGAESLDVFDIEPLPADHPLRDRDLIENGQLLLTPHLGYVTEATWRLFYGQTAEAIRAFAAVKPAHQL